MKRRKLNADLYRSCSPYLPHTDAACQLALLSTLRFVRIGLAHAAAVSRAEPLHELEPPLCELLTVPFGGTVNLVGTLRMEALRVLESLVLALGCDESMVRCLFPLLSHT